MGVYYTKHEKNNLFSSKKHFPPLHPSSHTRLTHLSHRQKYTNDMPINHILPPQPPLFTLFIPLFGTDY